MFCKNCGRENKPGSTFCLNCGTRMETFGAYPEKPKKKTGAIIGILAAVAVVATIAVFVVNAILDEVSFGGGITSNSAESVAHKAAKYALNGDFYKISRLYHKEVIKENDWDDKGFRDDCEDLEEEWNDYLEELEAEEGKVKLSYTIKDEDDITGDELDDIQEYYEDEYDLDVEEAKVFEVEICVQIGGEEEEADEEVVVVRIGGKWYLYDGVDIY